MKGYVKAFFLIAVLLVLVTFGIKNNNPLRLYYYFDWHTTDFPLYILVYASIILGIFLGMAIGINSRLKQRQKIKALEKEYQILKSKLPEKQKDESTADHTRAEQIWPEKTIVEPSEAEANDRK